MVEIDLNILKKKYNVFHCIIHSLHIRRKGGKSIDITIMVNTIWSLTNSSYEAIQI